jgi:tetratricopeptide (TPR) repeat protein
VAFAATLALTALTLCAALAVGMARPAHAHAQDTHEPPPEAIEFYARGRQLYQEGRYREAAVDLERALMLDPTSPNLVFNVARVYELLGELEKSIGFYHRYLQLLGPDEGEERERVQGTIRRLEGARDEVGAQTQQPPNPLERQLRDPQPVRVQERGVADALFWITASAGAALVIGGAVTGLLALNAQGEVRQFVVGENGTYADRLDIASRADLLSMLTDIFFVAGGVSVLASVLLFALRERTVERYPGLEEGGVQADVAVLLGGALFTLRGAL